MESFDKYFLKKIFEKVGRLRDRLAKIDAAIDWKKFRQII